MSRRFLRRTTILPPIAAPASPRLLGQHELTAFSGPPDPRQSHLMRGPSFSLERCRRRSTPHRRADIAAPTRASFSPRFGFIFCLYYRRRFVIPRVQCPRSRRHEDSELRPTCTWATPPRRNTRPRQPDIVFFPSAHVDRFWGEDQTNVKASLEI